eukprot:CAMPEP_0168607422 /NCGR_PEP_ID=MMETSP0449_2-20121227/32_1 /TAXON_ID=1082188 /ORGANISM="Strombidium rassoulzadegani, Strain ras09" /LENGTH=360 /DNA_ID=CAMNT_0008647233 /DNA_START=374 /DNA_END=1458 /DNA_ORIENTATION=+
MQASDQGSQLGLISGPEHVQQRPSFVHGSVQILNSDNQLLEGVPLGCIESGIGKRRKSRGLTSKEITVEDMNQLEPIDAHNQSQELKGLEGRVYKKQLSMVDKFRSYLMAEQGAALGESDDYFRLERYEQEMQQRNAIEPDQSSQSIYNKKLKRYAQSRSQFASFLSDAATSVVSKVSVVVQIEPGSMKGSVISLVASCLGAGTLTMPYIVSKRVMGAFVSYYAGMLIIKCNEMTGKTDYEEFAQIAFGKRFAKVVAVFFLTSLLGFATAYVALAKTLVPTAMESTFGKENLPNLMRDTHEGRIFMLTIVTFGLFLPLSLPRELSALRFSSALGVLCTLILMIVISYQFLGNKDLVASPE